MNTSLFHMMRNGEAVALAAIPNHTPDEFASALVAAVAARRRVCAYFAAATPQSGITRLYAVLADDAAQTLHVAATEVTGDSFAALTPHCPQVHLFEREIAEQFGLRPVDHPWLKPVRYCRSWNGRDAWGRSADKPLDPEVGDFYQIAGDEVHEVAVGPVHAGIIEPGHFRFQCGGEEVYHLEIALGYQHRGVEEALPGGPTARTLPLMETLSGDATIAHATAYSQVLEALAGGEAPPRAQALRAVALELERLACHIGDLGALAGDIGFLPTASYCGRIRGDFLNMTALLCGNRFGRGLVRPGGTGFDVDNVRCANLARCLKTGDRDATVAIRLLWETQSVLTRFEEVGIVPRATAQELGLVGPAARASGLDRDSRRDQPLGVWRTAPTTIATAETGDVLARARIRWLEIGHALTFIRERILDVPSGPVLAPLRAPAPEHLAVALVEGWRGEVCHVGITDADSRFARYKVVDPSFHNWSGLAYALRGQAISDFPICNKSFNLSYCGHDL